MKFNQQSITVRTDSERTFNTRFSQSITSYDAYRTELKATALEILLNGGYNKYARNINREEYEKIQKLFDNQISNMMHLIEVNKNKN